MAKLTKEQRDKLRQLPEFEKVNRLVSGVYLLNSIAMDFADESELILKSFGLRSGKIKSTIDNLNNSFDQFVSKFDEMMNCDTRKLFAEDYESVKVALRKFVEGPDNSKLETKDE